MEKVKAGLEARTAEWHGEANRQKPSVKRTIAWDVVHKELPEFVKELNAEFLK